MEGVEGALVVAPVLRRLALRLGGRLLEAERLPEVVRRVLGRVGDLVDRLAHLDQQQRHRLAQPELLPLARPKRQQELEEEQLVRRLDQRVREHLPVQVVHAVLAHEDVPARAAAVGPRVAARHDVGGGAQEVGLAAALDAARVGVGLAGGVVPVAEGAEEGVVLRLEEGDVEERRVRVEELEEEGLHDQRVLVLGLGAVVLEARQVDG